MSKQLRLSQVGRLAALLAGAALASGPAACQAPASSGMEANDWIPSRTAWGDPDLQGKWTNANTGTPMERPAEFGDREFLTDQEVAERVAAAAEVEEPPAGADPDEVEVVFPAAKASALPHEQGIKGEEYNKFWVVQEPRDATPWARTSLVIDPPDGRIPPLTLAAVERLEAREAARAHRGEADSVGGTETWGSGVSRRAGLDLRPMRGRFCRHRATSSFASAPSIRMSR